MAQARSGGIHEISSRLCMLICLCWAGRYGQRFHTGMISTVAGNGTSGSSGDGGPAISAQLSGIAGIAMDSAGNLYIADGFAWTIRKLSPDGVISTAIGASDC